MSKPVMALAAVAALVVAACGPGPDQPERTPDEQQPGQPTDGASPIATETNSPLPGTTPAPTDEVGGGDELSAVAATTWRSTIVVFSGGECIVEIPEIPALESPAPGTGSPSPGTESPVPGTASPTPGAASPTPGTESPAPGIDQPEPVAILHLTFPEVTVAGELGAPPAASPEPIGSPGTESPDVDESPAVESPDVGASPEPAEPIGDDALRMTIELASMPEDVVLPGGYPIELLAMPPFIAQGGQVTMNVEGETLSSASISGYLPTNMRSGFIAVLHETEPVAINFLCAEVMFPDDTDGPDGSPAPTQSPAVGPSPTVEPSPAASPVTSPAASPAASPAGASPAASPAASP